MEGEIAGAGRRSTDLDNKFVDFCVFREESALKITALTRSIEKYTESRPVSTLSSFARLNEETVQLPKSPSATNESESLLHELITPMIMRANNVYSGYLLVIMWS